MRVQKFKSSKVQVFAGTRKAGGEEEREESRSPQTNQNKLAFASNRRRCKCEFTSSQVHILAYSVVASHKKMHGEQMLQIVRFVGFMCSFHCVSIIFIGGSPKKGLGIGFSILSFLEFFLSVFPKIHRLADEFSERNGLVFKSFDMCHEQVRLLSHDAALFAFRRGNGF